MFAVSPDSVLIVEDEGLVSLMLEDLLRSMGARVVDVFGAAGDALSALAASNYDCAILDIIVRDGTSEPVADALADRGIPFLFSSGVGLEMVDARHHNRRLISKPYDDNVLASHIRELLRGETGTPNLA